jgi:hypothetical protein
MGKPKLWEWVTILSAFAVSFYIVYRNFPQHP